ncbi:MAG: long-chain fatty acid--CoA ligase [Candidatus Eremiobacteraeota bacterium]|nr:long-chain fatty acid--CoA ligase [Candidatus Eremiobacteraeota bacterium]MBC5807870.1 long-chain fatty acid--CoA ligase [Candidatus Eremiobacteraeota bacterium]
MQFDVRQATERELTRRQAAGELDRRIKSFIESGPGSAAESDAEFQSLALTLFDHQFDHNEFYRRYCASRGVTPGQVRIWSEIPAVPTSSFADVRLAAFPQDRESVRFSSSGSTRDGGPASVLELESTELYDASLRTHFKACVLPDMPRIDMVMLSPTFGEAPHSSLAYMLSHLFANFGAGGGFFVREGALDVDAAARALARARRPMLVFGTAFAFVHFFDACRERELMFALPPGSRTVETGGFKGRSRSLARDDFYRLLTEVFGVPRDFCISEYGMCELGSQCYDANLGDVLAGRPPRHDLKIAPHWSRWTVVNPVDERELPPGETGLLRCLDLSNRGSVAAVLTADLGMARAGGFRFVGRSTAAPPKGCSTAIDAMLSSA